MRQTGLARKVLDFVTFVLQLFRNRTLIDNMTQDKCKSGLKFVVLILLFMISIKAANLVSLNLK